MNIKTEYLTSPKSLETELIVKSNTDMKLSKYATISGIKGYQFGKEIFSAVLTFKDLEKFLNVFPEVQRSASSRKIGQIKNYILSGIQDASDLRFFNAITATTRGHVFYDEKTKNIAIDINNSKLSINDGQHRFYGISNAIQELKRRKTKAKSKEQFEIHEKHLNDLLNMTIPIIIFNNISQLMEKQLFHDLNMLASRPSKSSTIRLSQTDLFSKMACEISETNQYLLKYGVEVNKSSISGSNKNTILLTTVYVFCKNMFADEIHSNSGFLNKTNYLACKELVNNALNNMFANLPKDMYLKNKYILSKGYALRAISEFIYQKINDITVKSEDIYKAIANVDWKENIGYWSSFGASESEAGILLFRGSSTGGIRAIKQACEYELLNL